MNRRDFIKASSGVLAGTGALPFLMDASSGAESARGSDQKRAAAKLAPRFGDARDWWFEKRFGMFVHWGLYAINGYHEQEQWRRRVSRQDYVRLATQWNPARFNANEWLDLAASAGMQYICLTTKHHDGFCLWDTKQTDYNTINTPYGKDILRQLSEACQKRQFPLCLYYSIADWHHPNYPNQGRHHELPPQPGDQPDLRKYLDFLKAQVRELCSNYGEIRGFWWDMNVDKTVDRSINQMIRQMQPSAVINDRGFDEGDFGTPERDYDSSGEEVVSYSKRTEACQAVGSESWGYRHNEDYYTDRHLMRSIDKYLARDANYLLNVGPMPDGRIDAASAAMLRRVGKWYRKVRESFQGTVPATQLTANRNVLLTRRNDTIYVHLHKDPVSDGVKLRPIAVMPGRATLLNTGAPVRCTLEMAPSEHTYGRPFLRLSDLPVNKLANTVMVIRLEFEQGLGPDGGTSTDAQSIDLQK